MTPLPKRRHSTGRQGKRRASIALKLPTIIVCKQCGDMRLPHTVCSSCGYYDGKSVVAKRKKSEKK